MSKDAPFEPLSYSIADAAKVISLSRATLYNLIVAGELKAIRIPGMRRVLIARTDLEAWLTRQRDATA